MWRMLALALGTAPIVLCSTAAAQDEFAGGAERESPRESEIVVTAQRREEALQDVPIAISAFSGSALENANVDSLFDLPRLAPSLRIDTGIQSAKARIVIRGIGAAAGTAIEPSVATFLDGIYLPREGETVGAYLDLEAVEVLRGPQGTLFGRNASVGAISLRSARPTHAFSGRVLAEAGTGDMYKAEGYVNLPASERARFRVAALGESYDGDLHNLLDGRDLGGVDTFATRITGEFDLTSDIAWTLRGSYISREGDGMANYALLPDTFAPGRLQVYIDRFAALGSVVDLNPFDRTVNLYSGDTLDEEQYAITSDLRWELGQGYELRFLNGYVDWTSDQVGTPAVTAQSPGLTQPITWASESNSHEIQLISPLDQLLGGRLSFVAGLYYTHEQYTNTESFRFGEFLCRLMSALPAATIQSCVANADRNAFDTVYQQSADSLAVYGQGAFKFSDQVDLVLGARWTRDEKDAQIVQVVNHTIGFLAATNENTSLTLDQERPTWRANLNWRPTDDLLFYATYSTGYKSGGFNSLTSAIALGDRRIFRPETVDSYEVGARTTSFDDALVLNVSAYRMNVEGFQDRSYNGIGFAVQNAGDIRNQGVEFEATVQVKKELSFDLGVAYLDSVFTDYPGASPLPGTAGVQNITGKRPTFTPEWSGNVGFQFDSDLSETVSLLLRANVAFVSEQNMNAQNDANPLTVQDGYSLLSARGTLFLGPEQRWALSVFGENLADTDYCTSVAYQPFGGLFGVVAPGVSPLRCNTVGRSRSFGASISARF